MKNYVGSFLFMGLLTLLSCHQANEGAVATEALEADFGQNQKLEDRDEQETIENDADPQNDGVTIERKLIKTGDVRYKADNLAKAREQLLTQVAKWKGYISSEQENNSYGTNNVSFVIRVPAANFDSLVAGATLGVQIFDRKEIQVEDVTEQFVDIQARLHTKKLLETRYTELLKMAKTVQDVLEVEKELGNLRADIESMEGRLNYLKNQVGLSTLTISIYQELPTSNRFGSKLVDGLANGWNNLVLFVIGMVNIWPFIILGIVTIVSFRKWRKNKK